MKQMKGQEIVCLLGEKIKVTNAFLPYGYSNLLYTIVVSTMIIYRLNNQLPLKYEEPCIND